MRRRRFNVGSVECLISISPCQGIEARNAGHEVELRGCSIVVVGVRGLRAVQPQLQTESKT